MTNNTIKYLNVIFLTINLCSTISIETSDYDNNRENYSYDESTKVWKKNVADWSASKALVSIPNKEELQRRLQEAGVRYLVFNKEWFLDAICGKEIMEHTVATLARAVDLESRAYSDGQELLAAEPSRLRFPTHPLQTIPSRDFLDIACPVQGSRRQPAALLKKAIVSLKTDAIAQASSAQAAQAAKCLPDALDLSAQSMPAQSQSAALAQVNAKKQNLLSDK